MRFIVLPRPARRFVVHSAITCAVIIFEIAKPRPQCGLLLQLSVQPWKQQSRQWSRQSLGLGAEKSRVRNSLWPSLCSLRQGNQSALLNNGLVRWECSLGRAFTQAVFGPIVWAFRRHKKPRYRKISARGYALHSVCPQHPFPSLNIVSRYILHSDTLSRNSTQWCWPRAAEPR